MSNSEAPKKTAKTKAAATETVAKAEPKKPERLMYVGPTIPGVATQNVVYEELPAGLIDAQAKEPMFANLCIPVINYAEAEIMIREKKGYIWSAYKKALEYKEGGH